MSSRLRSSPAGDMAAGGCDPPVAQEDGSSCSEGKVSPDPGTPGPGDKAWDAVCWGAREQAGREGDETEAGGTWSSWQLWGRCPARDARPCPLQRKPARPVCCFLLCSGGPLAALKSSL